MLLKLQRCKLILPHPWLLPNLLVRGTFWLCDSRIWDWIYVHIYWCVLWDHFWVECKMLLHFLGGYSFGEKAGKTTGKVLETTGSLGRSAWKIQKAMDPSYYMISKIAKNAPREWSYVLSNNICTGFGFSLALSRDL